MIKTKMEQTYIIQIKSKHFRFATNFNNGRSCPLALALREQFKTTDIRLGFSRACINNVWYSFDKIWSNEIEGTEFTVDSLIELAKQNKFRSTFELTLTREY